MDFSTNDQNNHDSNQNNESENNSYFNFSNLPKKEPQPEPNLFIKMAGSLGVVAIVSAVFCTVYLPIVLGGLSIILALLSKGDLPTMHKKAKRGVILSIIAIVLNCGIIASSFYLVFTSSEYREQLNIMSEELYGQTFDESLEQIINGTYEDFNY